LKFVDSVKAGPKSEGEGREPSRFNSGKWLVNLNKNEEKRAAREQIVLLPEFSVHAKDRGSCVIRFRLDGVQHSFATGIKSKREAEAQAEGILARWLIARGEASPAKATGLQAEIEAFLEAEYADVKPATRTEAALILRRFASTFPFPNIQDVTREVFRKTAKAYRGEASAKYWANILSTTRRFSKSLVAQKSLLEDFTQDVPMPPKASFGRRETVWTPEEFETVLDALEPFDRDVLMVMRWTGMDSSDVAELLKKHILKDSEGNWIIKKRREKAKTDDETIVQPISSQAREILLGRYKGISDRLFGNMYATPRSFTTSLLGRVRRAAGPTKDLKSLRHTYATYHAERGVPLDVLRVWMGHAKDSRVLDRIYLHRASTARFMD
jgi:integrase